MPRHRSNGDERPFRPGNRVRVRGPEEIRATLDGAGTVDGLPFLPEMAAYCEGIHRVKRSLNRVLVEGFGVRGVDDVYILEDARCSGAHHGPCHRLCSLLWKKSWLEPVDADEDSAPVPRPAHRWEGVPGSRADSCQGQADVLMKASYPLPVWQPRQYLRDLRTGNMSVPALLKMAAVMAYVEVYWRWLKKYWSLARRRRKVGPSGPALQKGAWVEVLRRSQIRKTLGPDNRCQGLLFAEAMWRCCGKRFRVAQKVETMIVEETGAFQRVRDVYLLENATCDGVPFRGCPRQCYWFWKGAWLRPVAEVATEEPSDIRPDRA